MEPYGSQNSPSNDSDELRNKGQNILAADNTAIEANNISAPKKSHSIYYGFIEILQKSTLSVDKSLFIKKIL
jgi:hypothetical protein